MARSGICAPTARRPTPVNDQHAAGVHEQLLHAYLLGDVHVMFVFDVLSLGQRLIWRLEWKNRLSGPMAQASISFFFPRGSIPRARNSVERTAPLPPLFSNFPILKATVRPPLSVGYKDNASRIWHNLPGTPNTLPTNLTARVKVGAALWGRYPLLAVTPPRQS